MRIGLLWHSLRHPNLGVDALTRANIAIIRAAAAKAGVTVEFLLLGQVFEPGRDDEFPDVAVGAAPSLKDVLKGRSRFLADVATCDIIFDLGEGDSFADIYGVKRFVQQIASKLFVLAKGIPLILSPQTIGPFSRNWTGWLAARVMSHCCKVFARDHLSAEVLRKLGVTGNTDEFVDVAFRLPYRRPAPTPGGRVRVGVNVSALLFHGGYSGANELGLKLDYVALTNQLLQYFTARTDVEVIFVPHVLELGDAKPDESPDAALASEASTSEDDRVVSCYLAARYEGSIVAPRFGKSTEAKDYISGLDFLIAGRMHACIGAVSSGVAVMPISYSRKFNGLFGGLGYNWLVDARSHSTDDALRRVIEGFEARSVLKTEAEVATAIALARLDRYEAAVADLLTSVSR